MTSVAAVPHSQLTQNDITRLPKHAIQPQTISQVRDMRPDTFGENKESHTLRNTIIGLAVAAAAIVGIKHWGANSFLKIQDANNMKWYDHIKKWTTKLGDWIEYPFVKLKGVFSKKTDAK